MTGAGTLDTLAREIAACTVCRDRPAPGKPRLPHDPRPVLQISSTARLMIAGQAPGTKVHASGRPFTDPSGDRLRQWLGLDEDTFYDAARLAIVPMGFCFPGQDARGADLPPRTECAAQWRHRLMQAMPQVECILAIGMYAQGWHLAGATAATLTETVKNWRDYASLEPVPVIPLPHPSWRNTAWLKKNPWFERDVVPHLQGVVKELVLSNDR